MTGIGAALRKGRLALGLSLERAAVDTRISLRFLEALEDERFADLPAPVYVRGFLRSYSSYLRLDAGALIGLLPPEFAIGTTPVPGTLGPREATPRPGGRDPWRPAGDRNGRPPDGPQAREWPSKAAPGGTEPAPRPLPPPVIDDLGLPAGAARPRTSAVPEPGAASAGGGAFRWIAAVLGGFFVLASVAVLVLIFDGGDGPSQGGVPPLPTATPAAGRTVVPPPGSPTSTPGGPSPGPTAIASPSASPGAAGSPSPTPGPGTPTATPQPGTATPASPSPTTTPLPPTLTPTPAPTATPTRTPVPHPAMFEECREGICQGPDGRIRVVCAPDGPFVDRTDVNGTFPASDYGWSVATAGTNSQVRTACD